MSKIAVDQVALILKQHPEITPATLREIIEEMNNVTQPDGDEPAAPKAKTQYVIVANADASFGWVVTLPEDQSPASVLDRVHKSAHDFNASKRGRLLPVKSIGEAFESVSRKFFKNNDVGIKTKLMVPIITTTNQLPEAPSV